MPFLFSPKLACRLAAVAALICLGAADPAVAASNDSRGPDRPGSAGSARSAGGRDRGGQPLDRRRLGAERQAPRRHRQIVRRDQPHRDRRRRQGDHEPEADRAGAAHRLVTVHRGRRPADAALRAELHDAARRSATRRTTSTTSPRRSRPSSRSARPRPKARSKANSSGGGRLAPACARAAHAYCAMRSSLKPCAMSWKMPAS